jgi:long-chain acyl-CoA synthetase
MGRSILVTGVTGHLGPHLLAALLVDGQIDEIFALVRGSGASPAAERLRDAEAAALDLIAERGEALPRRRLTAIVGRLTETDLGLQSSDRSRLERQVDVVIHGAADTRVTAPLEELRSANVEGTKHVCGLAARCARLRQLLLVSTTCVAGRRTGRIPEDLLDDAAGFVNAYEQTKWEAEQIVAASGLPARVARLATCFGSHRSGYVHRFGAVHHLLRWVDRGLVPLVPGTPETLVDLISSDVAADWLARAAAQDPPRPEVCHVSLGDAAIAIENLLSAAATRHRPLLVDRGTFDLFQRMVEQSGDLLFARVNASAGAVLPGLVYPKRFATAEAERCWGGSLPHPDWMAALKQVMAFGRARRWGRLTGRESYA